MADTPISFDNPVEDDDMNTAFARGAAERGACHRVRVTTEPDAARLLPPFVTAPPRRVVPRNESSQHDA